MHCIWQLLGRWVYHWKIGFHVCCIRHQICHFSVFWLLISTQSTHTHVRAAQICHIVVIVVEEMYGFNPGLKLSYKINWTNIFRRFCTNEVSELNTNRKLCLPWKIFRWQFNSLVSISFCVLQFCITQHVSPALIEISIKFSPKKHSMPTAKFTENWIFQSSDQNIIVTVNSWESIILPFWSRTKMQISTAISSHFYCKSN